LNRLLIILVFCSLFSFSQEKEVEDITSYPNSVITLNINYNSWTNPPPTMEISPLSVGFDIYGLYTFMGKNKFVSLAAGGGFGIQNVKSNSSLINADSSYFQTLPKELNYRKNKITTVFIDVPIELRFRVRPNSRDKAGIVRKRNFRVALGFKVGYNIQRYIKYDGDDYRLFNYGNEIKFKEYRIKNNLLYRYGVYARIGVGKLSLSAYYALSNFFETDKGPTLRPFAFGISVNI